MRLGIDIACIGMMFLPVSGRWGDVGIWLKRFNKNFQKKMLNVCKIDGEIAYIYMRADENRT